MSSKRALLASVVVLFSAGCVAGVGTDSDGLADGGGGSDNSGGTNEGGSEGPGFGQGPGGGTDVGCNDPSCIGTGTQGDCDTGLAIDSSNAMDGARAIGICKEFVEGSWGVKEAQWVRSDGQPLTGMLLEGKGILDNFGGLTPREGTSMLSISSGAARAPGDPGFQGAGVTGYSKDDFNAHGSPVGYPKESPACPNVTTGSPYDSAGLRLVIRTPTDAKSFTYDFDFHTFEFPVFICTQWNDFFVAMLSPKIGELPDGNISFDAQGNTISVNAGFLQVCTPQTAGGKVFDCPLGPGELTGTNFESHAATSWLQTSAPVEAPGTDITLDFLIWDSGDTAYDSTTLIDNFRFELDETVTGTQPVPE